MPLTASRALLRQTERWFIRRGVPTLIEEYRFTTHVLPRMLPFLALTALGSLTWLVPEPPGPYGRLLVLLAVAALGVGAWSALTAFGRRLPRFTRVTTTALLAMYVALPVLIPLLVEAWYENERAEQILGQPASAAVVSFASTHLMAIVVAWLVTAYGLVPLTRLAVEDAVRDMRNSVRLQGRALPMLLFVTLFFFFTGELWQAMNRLVWWRMVLMVALFAAVTVLAAAARLRDEIGRVEQDLSPPRLSAACRDTPLAGVPLADIAPDGPLQARPLEGSQVANLLVGLALRQLVQAGVVGLGLFAFFMVLGAIVVDPATAEQWLGEPARPWVWLPELPAALPRAAALLAGFGSMYFAVTSMSDSEHRRQFFAPILDEVERTLVVRAAYLAVRDVVLPPSPRQAAAPDGGAPDGGGA